MSDVFNLDNAGSGFSLDEEDDLDALMAEAEAGVEVDEEDEDTSSYFDTPTPPDRVFTAGPASESSTDQEDTSTYPAEGDTLTPPDQGFTEVSVDSAEDRPSEDLEDQALEAQVTEDATEEVVSEETLEPEIETDSEEHSSDSLVSESLDSTLIARILRISSTYRALGDHERKVVSQFINNGEVIEAEEDLVLAVLNADSALTKVMRALHEGRALESIDRAFYVIELDEPTLKGVGSLMTVFGNEEIPSDLPHSKYARAVVSGIDKLDNTSMELVNATEAVLSAGEVVSG